jgi:signal transduction histidine kinase
MRPEIRLPLIYWLIACVWILFSDFFLFNQPLPQLFVSSTLKGLGFVTVTAVLLYILLRREFQKRDQLNRQRLEAHREQHELRLALNHESELRDVRSKFVSMLSHEFRTPLASIQTSLDLLDQYSERMPDEDKAKRYKRMRSQIKEVTELLDEALILMKNDTVGLDFHPENVDVIALCKSVVEQIRQNDEQQHEFVCETDLSELYVNVDPKLLRYAMRNLMTNAVKYSPPDSTISVSLSFENQQLVIRVSDQGIGIPKAEQKRVFETFFRAANAHDLPGTGLGLAITKQAVDLHNGALELESTVGVGTTFTMKLPLQAQPLSVTS